MKMLLPALAFLLAAGSARAQEIKNFKPGCENQMAYRTDAEGNAYDMCGKALGWKIDMTPPRDKNEPPLEPELLTEPAPMPEPPFLKKSKKAKRKPAESPLFVMPPASASRGAAAAAPAPAAVPSGAVESGGEAAKRADKALRKAKRLAAGIAD